MCGHYNRCGPCQLFVGLPNSPNTTSLLCTRFSPQDSQERHSSHLNRALTTPPMSADQACVSARLSVLVAASWPCAWLLPCAGSASRCFPCQLQSELWKTNPDRSVLRPRSPRSPHASLKSSATWPSRFKPCRTLCDIMLLRHHSFDGLQVVFEGAGWWYHKGQRGRFWH